MDGFAAAFQSFAPSFHPIDLCVGAACAVALRLAVYIKGKNAKKYRKNMEYGSARFGTPEDIKPYIAPAFEDNIILTQTERLTMNSRPKDPKPLTGWQKIGNAWYYFYSTGVMAVNTKIDGYEIGPDGKRKEED